MGVEVRTPGVTSRKLTITHPRGSSEWTGRDRPLCSTVSCTKCATIDLEKSTLNQASQRVMAVSAMQKLATKILSLMYWRKRILQSTGWCASTKSRAFKIAVHRLAVVNDSLAG